MDSSEDETDPTKILLPENKEDDDSDYSHRENESTITTTTLHQDQDQELTNLDHHHHHLNSIDSTVVIRQLPSQGLSFQLWPAATTLVNLLDNHHRNPSHAATSSVLSIGDQRQIRILELGSGTGLVGISAAVTLSAAVTVTDLPGVVENLKFNAEMNSEMVREHGGRVEVAALRWGESEDMERIGRDYDVVLGSDLVYHSHLYEILLRTLKFLLGGEDKCVFVMAHLRRWKKDSVFFKKARKLFHVQVIANDAPEQGCRIGVVVYTFVAKRFKPQ